MAITFEIFRFNLMTNYINPSAATKSFSHPFPPRSRKEKIFYKSRKCARLIKKKKISLVSNRLDVKNNLPMKIKRKSTEGIENFLTYISFTFSVKHKTYSFRYIWQVAGILATGLGRTSPRGRGNVPPPSWKVNISLVGVMSPSS